MARRKTTSTRKPTRSSTSTRRKSTTSRSTSRSRSSRSTSRRPQFKISLDLPQKALILGIFLIFVTFIIVLSLLSPNQGQLTAALSTGMWRLFGLFGVVIPFLMAATGFYLVLWGMGQAPRIPGYRLLGILLLLLAAEAFASLVWVLWDNGLNDYTAVAQAGTGGGYLGGFVAWAMTVAIGPIPALFVLLVLGVIGAILLSGISRQDVAGLIQHLRQRGKVEEPALEIPINPGRTPAAGQTTTNAAGPRQPPLLPPEEAPQVAAAPAGPGPAPPAKGRAKAGRQPAAAALPDQERLVAPTPVFLGSGLQQSWTLPELDKMLEAGHDQEVSGHYIREQVEIIEHTLESFGAPAAVVEINQGPTITQYGVEPSFIEQRGGKRTKVKVGKIASLADDLALALAARSIRIQAPVPGKGYVGIEVPNTEKATVSLRDVMEAGEFQRIKSPLRIGLGQNVAGQPIATDLTQMPHLLIAGTTGAGKSVCVNSIIACLLLQNTPDDLKIVMVDPKRVELTGYNGVPHLVAPVIVELERVVGTLQWAMREMDNRYKRLADMGARNIGEFNKKAKGKDKMPYIVIFIDELADLMMLSPEETERGITRLAQMARATGIHMVIATQRPSVDVVTGLIKANFPARIAFAVASSTDSRVILDTTGAERLLGQGDMLFQSPDAAAPVRMQGCFVSEGELNNIIDYWRGARRFQPTPPVGAAPVAVEPAAEAGPAEETAATARPAEATTETAPPPAEKTDETRDIRPVVMPTPAPARPRPSPPPSSQQPLWEELQAAEQAAQDEDELLPEAIAMVQELNKASTSLLQRRFRIGYTRAARMIDTMEERGIIGPPTGTSKAREVLQPAAEEGDAAKDNSAAEDTDDLEA
jgi:DNA segregation ATPase FtsK/SpoIIIE, S-DNA-T family